MSKRESVLEYFRYELQRCKTAEARQCLLNEYERNRAFIHSGLAARAADKMAEDQGRVGTEEWKKLDK